MDYLHIDDFAKVRIQIGKIVLAEPVADADKLIRFEVDLGGESPVQILSGIRMAYDDYTKLVGTLVPVVVNLAPRKFKGLDSNGMILYAIDGERVVPLHPEQSLSSGSIVR